MGDLAKSVTCALANTIGVPLQQVVVRALGGEISHRDELADPLLYIGGEVRLDFEGHSVFVSWAQSEGWPVFCSIGVRPETFFAQNSTLVDWVVSDLDHWSGCVGQRLLAGRVFAIDDTPHVVEFSFEGQAFWMACGQERNVGDGTDLLIRPGGFPGMEGAKRIWPL